MLLRREFWEHRGGFFWAPVVTGAIVLLIGLLGTITSTIMLQRAKERGLVDMGHVQAQLDGHEQVFGAAGDITLLTGVGIACAVLVFVVFFYSLGSLYDERRDRSVLFWKSLPVSDTATVLSKVTWALLLAPALAVAIGLLIGFGMWLLSALSLLLSGIPGIQAMLTESHPFRVLMNTLLVLPVYSFWALPTVGWLMFCSAWARRVPFLWAVLVPLLAAVLISWLDTLPGLEIPHDRVWYTLVFRGLVSIVPGTWYFHPTVDGNVADIDNPQDIARALDLSASWQAFTTLDLWIGAIIGAALIYAAIRLRRWRDEG
ncbi:MAG TPA: ABC transporter permease [Lysobacter sp.]|nr:ABC transporter permease [Lysobacter sp.]